MKKWLLVLPWVVAVSTSLPFREGQVTTYPMVYGQAIETLACPNDKNHCLWVQDFVEAMNEAHEKRARDSYNSAPHHSISVDNR